MNVIERRTTTDVCADCSAPGPSWASINRGVFVCDDCCSVHRSLGRHVSEIRSLHHGYWPPTLMELVRTLVSKGANTIWEHALLDPAMVKTGRRKPSAKEKLHPTKANFINAKYKLLAYMNRLPVREEDLKAVDDLSKQLHASVRTNNLETCLRLLALGAKVNYLHPDRGNMALHVAASAGQVLQCELLVLHGADPCALDSRGHTPVECARIAGYHELADRLIECQYELTDRLAFYVCGRRPVHVQGEHHILPSLNETVDVSEPAVAARQKLHALPNPSFEELAADVYDEIDRRETDGVWLATQHHSDYVSNQHPVPFLPVNPAFSSTRNQGRQKLATFNARDFATLIIDILTDAKRRQMESVGAEHSDGNLVPTDGVEVIQQQHLDRQQQKHLPQGFPPTSFQNANAASTPKDRVEHDYDEVYLESGRVIIGTEEFKQKKGYQQAAVDEPDGSGHQPSTPQEGPLRKTTPGEHSSSEAETPKAGLDDRQIQETKGQLSFAQERIQQLLQVNTGMGEEIRLLQAMVQKLMQENSMLRTLQLSRGNSPIPQTPLYSTSSTGRRAFSHVGSLERSQSEPPPVPIKQKYRTSPTNAQSTAESVILELPANSHVNGDATADCRDAQTPNSVFDSPPLSRSSVALPGTSGRESPSIAALERARTNDESPALGNKPHTRAGNKPAEPPEIPPKKKKNSRMQVSSMPFGPYDGDARSQLSSSGAVTVSLQLLPKGDSTASVTLNTYGANGISSIGSVPNLSSAGVEGKPIVSPKPSSASQPDTHVSLMKTPALRSKSTQCVLTDAGGVSSTSSTPSPQHKLHLNGNGDSDQPDQSKVVQQTEQITKRIQDLLLVAQQQELVKFVPCSRKIATAVNDMAALFVQRPESEGMRTSLRLLVSSASQLQDECREGHSLSAYVRRFDDGSLNQDERAQVALVTQRVIQCAYDIAKAAKQLVQHVESS